MGSIYRRRGKDGKPKGPYWIAWVDSRGRQHSKSTRIKGRPGTGYDFNAAKRELAAIEGDTVKGLPITPAVGRLPFVDALNDVTRDQHINARRATSHTAARIKGHLAPFFDGLRVSEVGTTQIRAYVAHRKAEGAQAATINRELAIVRRAFRLALRAGHILTMPHVELLDESRNVRKGFVEPDDFARVRKALEPEVYADATETAFVTGWRLRSDVLTIRWSQVDFKGGLLRIDPGQTKAGEGRNFPLTARLRDIFERRQAAKAPGSPLVFHLDGATIKPKPFYRAWKAACAAAEVGDRIPHDLRRSAVREMERRQIPRQVAMKLVGHRTESIYRRYAIVSEADIRDAGARLDQPPTAKVSTAKVLHSGKSTKARPRITRKNTQ